MKRFTMENTTILPVIIGANWTTSRSSIIHGPLKCESCLPTELTEISESSLVFIITYCIIFVVAASGNVIAIHSFWRKYKGNRSGTTLLLLHLSVADLIVCCTLIPTEVFWRLTIQWMGGNVLCKVTQFFRTFGLYLSSLVLIGVSCSRFLAIMFPMSMINTGTYHRINVMLALAWIIAAVFSAPQAVFFSVQGHPDYPSFKQCVTDEFLESSQHVKVYSIFSLTVIYFVPLVVILCTYTAILVKLVKKSQERSPGNHYNVMVCIYRRSETSGGNEQGTDNVQIEAGAQMSCCSHAESVLAKAKTKTFVMTCVIVTAFVFCWTPYAFMTLWYMFDWNGAKEVDSRVQDALFLMAVANSCINPLIYGGFSYSQGKPRRERYCCCWRCCIREIY